MTQAHARTRDFSKKRPPVYFTIDDVRYDCYKALDFDQLRRFAGMASNMSQLSADLKIKDDGDEEDELAAVSAAQEAITQIGNLMKIVMKKTSYATFMEKFAPSDEDRERDDFEPIDHTQLLDIVKWLMEVYTDRPSRPSSNSSDSSSNGDGGASSTDGASPAEFAPTSLPEPTPSIS